MKQISDTTQVKIGTVLSSPRHREYVVLATNPRTKLASDFRVGDFVRVGEGAVALIYDLEILNPNALAFSEQKQQEDIFAPDLRDDIDVLIRVYLLGELYPVRQSPPLSPLEAGTAVFVLSDFQIRDFHFLVGESGVESFALRYLLDLQNLSLSVAELLCERLISLIPERAELVSVLLRQMKWQKFQG